MVRGCSVVFLTTSASDLELGRGGYLPRPFCCTGKDVKAQAGHLSADLPGLRSRVFK